ncbi:MULTISPECIES: hypothetical protein [Bartonella]|uniref:hypothetical protein n=1 Tax=Bartonella TaxID=773 RepID=UPI002362F066|nr:MULTISPECIES: hypothetical protein [Bartonella]
MGLIALIISCIANLCSCYAVYTNFKNIKMLRQAIKERDELIASQRALIDGQLAENEKKIKHLQELQEEKKKRLPKNPQGQECVTSYENIYETLQEPEDVRALVREFVEKAPVINKYSDEKDDDRARKILQQLMMDEQRKNEAIEIIEDFNRWFMAKQSVTVAEANKWDRAQYLSFLLMKPKPMTWAELAEKSPEEQQRYSSCWKTVIY